MLLACNMVGSDKLPPLPPLVTGRYISPHYFKNVIMQSMILVQLTVNPRPGYTNLTAWEIS